MVISRIKLKGNSLRISVLFLVLASLSSVCNDVIELEHEGMLAMEGVIEVPGILGDLRSAADIGIERKNGSSWIKGNESRSNVILWSS